MNKYLFLDIDGVLHPSTPPRDLRYIKNLAPTVARLELKVVVSSTWREAYSLTELTKLLGDLGHFVVGKTPTWNPPNGDLPAIGVRHREIEAWLVRKASLEAPWAAIDDDAENFRPNCTRVFLTDRTVGLDANTAILFDKWCANLFDG
mgnify:FL=1